MKIIIILFLSFIYLMVLAKLCIPIDENTSKKYKTRCLALYLLGIVTYTIALIISMLGIRGI